MVRTATGVVTVVCWFHIAELRVSFSQDRCTVHADVHSQISIISFNEADECGWCFCLQAYSSSNRVCLSVICNYSSTIHTIIQYTLHVILVGMNKHIHHVYSIFVWGQRGGFYRSNRATSTYKLKYDERTSSCCKRHRDIFF